MLHDQKKDRLVFPYRSLSSDDDTPKVCRSALGGNATPYISEQANEGRAGYPGDRRFPLPQKENARQSFSSIMAGGTFTATHASLTQRNTNCVDRAVEVCHSPLRMFLWRRVSIYLSNHNLARFPSYRAHGYYDPHFFFLPQLSLISHNPSFLKGSSSRV